MAVGSNAFIKAQSWVGFRSHELKLGSRNISETEIPLICKKAHGVVGKNCSSKGEGLTPSHPYPRINFIQSTCPCDIRSLIRTIFCDKASVKLK